MRTPPKLALAIALFATTAYADEYEATPTREELPPKKSPDYMANTGVQLGARVAYAAGVGQVYEGLNVTESSNGGLPIIVDVGWRIVPAIYLGVYGQFAPVFLKTHPLSCPSGFDCSAQNWRFGVEADFHFIPKSRFDPYAGVGVGYEMLHTTYSGLRPITVGGTTVTGTQSVEVFDHGMEFLSLTLGFDARIDRFVGIGPFVSASANQYMVHTGDATISAGTTLMTVPVPSVTKVPHGLGLVGVRGTFNL